MIRCKPLLGTYVEIRAKNSSGIFNSFELNEVINEAFSAIESVQSLMGFHNPDSELSKINERAHIETLAIHPWTFEVLRIAKEIHEASSGIFDCGVGSKLVEAGLLPNHHAVPRQVWGGLTDLILEKPNHVRSTKPVQIDLGGIAKGFAVDKAVEILKAAPVDSGLVNAGGDMRVFGVEPHELQIRSPSNPKELISIGSLQDGAIASTSLYYSDTASNSSRSPLVNPMNMEQIEFIDSYSVIASECIYADALTKVLAISNNSSHPCFTQFSAHGIRIS
ncbi:FAD:protein FMN transferase [Polynucleobacter asymbioticus]|jgi:thiamine biosynthesis lipoprotein|uniref:FAD:protein FMN transferase n=1 Tax=Polynucleobacter asymbioticus TaxID=576611 RepID=A0AAC9NI80_9BURK|nr:FAD:protein FMN transferase [Polynucleobacter asymbioticus]APB99444.1 ApbE family lipoprotein [Polynucleobacter asymbioticus]APC01751.1 ApbE family lipoprotein [Polynucleobacter asymbioticus]